MVLDCTARLPHRLERIKRIPLGSPRSRLRRVIGMFWNWSSGCEVGRREHRLPTIWAAEGDLRSVCALEWARGGYASEVRAQEEHGGFPRLPNQKLREEKDLRKSFTEDRGVKRDQMFGVLRGLCWAKKVCPFPRTSSPCGREKYTARYSPESPFKSRTSVAYYFCNWLIRKWSTFSCITSATSPRIAAIIYPWQSKILFYYFLFSA
jgi:hypothetical protein